MTDPIAREQLSWLRDARSELDGVIAAASRRVGGEDRCSGYVWRAAFDDLLALSEGRDCCYDRPTIGVQYSLWYQGRRTEPAIRALAPAIEGRAEPMEVLDLGCGTGAGAWAVALIEASRVATGAEPRRIHVSGVELSTSMLDHAERMWHCLETWLRSRRIDLCVTVDWHLETWTSAKPTPATSTIVFGSHFLDWSDVQRSVDLARSLRGVVDAANAEAVVLTGTHAKRHVLAAISNGLSESPRWVDAAPTSEHLRTAIWSGTLAEAGAVRRRLAERHGLPAQAARPPTWSYEETFVASFNATGAGASPSCRSPRWPRRSVGSATTPGTSPWMQLQPSSPRKCTASPKTAPTSGCSRSS